MYLRAVHPFHFSANTAKISRQFKTYLEAILQLKRNTHTNSAKLNFDTVQTRSGFSVWHVIDCDDMGLKKPLTEERRDSIMQWEVHLHISFGYARERSQLGLWAWQVTKPIWAAQAQQQANSEHSRPRIADIWLTKPSATSAYVKEIYVVPCPLFQHSKYTGY